MMRGPTSLAVTVMAMLSTGGALMGQSLEPSDGSRQTNVAKSTSDAPPVSKSQTDPTSTDALVAELARVTKEAYEEPQDTVSYEHIKRILSALRDRGVSEPQARAMAAGLPAPAPSNYIEEPPVVPTRFDEQLPPTVQAPPSTKSEPREGGSLLRKPLSSSASEARSSRPVS